METQQQSSRFVGKKIENTLCFNNAEIPSGSSSATPLSFAVPIKKKSLNNSGINSTPLSIAGKQQQNNKNTITARSSSSRQEEDKYQIKKADTNYGMQLPFQDKRGQLKKSETEKVAEKKDISMIAHAECNSNASSDCEEFQEIMAPKKNEFQLLLAKQKQYQQQQQQQPFSQKQMGSSGVTEKDGLEMSSVDQGITEEKRQADIDEMIRKSNLKFKNEKKLQEIETLQKLSEAQKLKDKLKQQEEEIRKRNQLKTQQFKDKKKKEKILQQQKQQQLEQLKQEKSQQRRKSASRLSINYQHQSKSVQSEMYDQEDNERTDRTDKSDSNTLANNNKEQFDLATKNRVRELMRKQKEEKERELEEKQMKKVKLEMLRQDQLMQLQKAKVKTKEQEIEERKGNQVKRIGGGGGSNNISGIQGKQDKIYEAQQNLQQPRQQLPQQTVVRPKSAKSNSQLNNKSMVIKKQGNNNFTSNGNQGDNNNNMKVSDTFLKEQIHKSIKQLYPNCSLEELIQLEGEYRKEFQAEIAKEQRANSLRRKNNNSNSSSIRRNSKGGLIPRKKSIGGIDKNEMAKLLKLQQLGELNLDSVRNPAEMINSLKALAEELEGDLENNDKKFGIGKYKRQERDANGNQKSIQEDKKKIKQTREEYIEELYQNAQDYFSPEEMIDFEKYLENHLDEGDYDMQGSEDEDGEQEEVEDNDDNEFDEQIDSNGKQFVSRKDSLHLIKVAEKQQGKQSSSNKKQLQINRQNNHSQEHSHRGRSQRPKSCLSKEAKEKRSKTVTFDSQYVNSAQNTQNSLINMSPSIKSQSSKYGFQSFEDFKDRFHENKENSRKTENNSKNQKASLESAEQEVLQFERKLQEIKGLALQYSGDKRGDRNGSKQQYVDQLDNHPGSQQSGSGSTRSEHKSIEKDNIQQSQSTKNASKSHVNKQQLTSKQQNISKQLEQLQIQLSGSNPKQQQQEAQQKQNNKYSETNKQLQKGQLQNINTSKQETKQSGRLNDLDIIDFNENFDLRQFNQQMNNEDLKQLVQLDGMDFGQYFTNERLNDKNSKQQLIPNQDQSQQPGQKQQQYQFYDDDDDEDGLFAEDGVRYYQEYCQNNKQFLQSSAKRQQNENVSEQGTQDLVDDDKLFALSATELLQRAYLH